MTAKRLTFFMLLVSEVCFAQTYTLSGQTMDEKNQPLSGVLLHIAGTTQGAVSDASGTYRLEYIPTGIHLLEVSFLGYETIRQSIHVSGQLTLDFILKPAIYNLDLIEVTHHLAGQNTPVTYKNLDVTALEKYNTGQDLPYLLRQSPSLVITSDAGNGIGYSGLRIRGSDPTRINVTINGVPLNDAESQNVFWVDLPDVASSTQSIQIQRGVGNSQHGAGAFGATINLNTDYVARKPHLKLSSSAGSFNTLKGTLELGTGLLNDRFGMDVRLSRIGSDGYIDRARTDLKSVYASALWLGRNQSWRAVFMDGQEVTYQAWNGVPAQYRRDRRTYNSAGMERPGSPHPQEVDDYGQTHAQLIHQRQLSSAIDLNLTTHYTRGKGFFEQYKASQTLTDYQLELPGTPEATSDLIRRRWLDNHFFGLIGTVKWQPDPTTASATLGAAWNEYRGNHFGEVTWSRTMGTAEQGHRYYDNDAVKRDLSSYVQGLWTPSWMWSWYADLQYRQVNYQFQGVLDDGTPATQQVVHRFLNPKAGLTWRPSEHLRGYLSFGVAHKEPNRDDYVDSNPGSRPQAERLYDGEAGINQERSNYFWHVNLFYMHYRNQLVLTGKLNDVGAYTRINIPVSKRVGLELDGSYQFNKRLSIRGDMTLSNHRIKKYTEYIDDWDHGTQIAVARKNTSIVLSPALTGHLGLTYTLWQKSPQQTMQVSWESLGVSRQFLDNSGLTAAALPGYVVHDLFFRWQLQTPKSQAIQIILQVQNVLNRRYASNGWIYRFRSAGYDPRPDDPYAEIEQGDFYHLAGYFNQATRHIMVGVEYKIN